jgi:peptidyl-prolyl cis-trans isomerase B (cyclophilin B)
MTKQITFMALVSFILVSLITGIIMITSMPHITTYISDYIKDDNYVAIIKLSGGGKMKIELFDEVAPISVENFKEIANSGAYTGSVFHRVIENFMIQGGIVNAQTTPITGEFSSNGIENNLLHVRGVISMARTGIPDSATSQFFIMHKDYPSLNGEYAAFGYLLNGYDVLDRIATTATNSSDRPITDIVIKSIKVRKKNIFEKLMF